MYSAFIVDDENLIIKSLKASVDWEMLGFEVVGEANDGIEAYERILQLRPDIVFADIRMPGMSGLELTKKVMNLYPNILFVIISGYAEFAYAQKAMSYGVLGYCLKPFDEIEIISVLQKARGILEKLKISLETEFIGLLGDNCNNARKRIKAILDMTGLELSENKGIVVSVSIGPEELTVPSGIKHMQLKCGRSRYAYLFSDSSKEKVKRHFEYIESGSVKGIGLSKVCYQLDSIGDAIDEAYIAANQYFMTGKNGVYLYGDFNREDLKTTFLQLEDAIKKRDVNLSRKALDIVENELSKGVYNIKHAFQVYNIIMYSFYIINSESYESYIFDYEQLISSFDGVHEMFDYLKRMLKEYAGVKTEHFPIDARNETFRSILLFVNEHYCEDFSIQTISREFTINPSYVSQLFKKQIGTTFTEYITSLRVNYACNLLLKTDFAVSEVAEKVGFSDYYYFTRVFKKTTGVTPTCFRDRQ